MAVSHATVAIAAPVNLLSSAKEGISPIVAQAEHGQHPSINYLSKPEESLAQIVHPTICSTITGSIAHPPGTPPYLRTFSLPSRFPVTIVSGEAECRFGQTSDRRAYKLRAQVCIRTLNGKRPCHRISKANAAGAPDWRGKGKLDSISAGSMASDIPPIALFR